MASKVFLFFRAVAVWISVRAPRQQNGRHFAWPVRVLTSGILQIRKKFQNPGNLRILELLSNLQNSTCKYPYRSCELPQFLFHLKLCGAVWAPRRQKWRPFSLTLEILTSNQIKYLFPTKQYKHEVNGENIVHGIITTLSIGKGICGELLSEWATEVGSKSLFTSGAHLWSNPRCEWLCFS